MIHSVKNCLNPIVHLLCYNLSWCVLLEHIIQRMHFQACQAPPQQCSLSCLPLIISLFLLSQQLNKLFSNLFKAFIPCLLTHPPQINSSFIVKSLSLYAYMYLHLCLSFSLVSKSETDTSIWFCHNEKEKLPGNFRATRDLLKHHCQWLPISFLGLSLLRISLDCPVNASTYSLASKRRLLYTISKHYLKSQIVRDIKDPSNHLAILESSNIRIL